MSKYTIKNIDNKSKVCHTTIDIIIKAENIIAKKNDAIKNIGENINIDGFRPGHIPEKVIINKIGDLGIYEESCRMLIDEVFFEIINETKEIPVNRPDINITKIAVDTDAELRINYATKPIIELNDYKSIAISHNKNKENISEIKVEDKEIEDMLMNLRKQVAHMKHHHENPEDHNHEHGDIEPVEIDDEFAKLCGPFQNVEELKKAIIENIAESKKQKTLEKYRIALIDEVIEKSNIQYPEFILESEKDIMIEELKGEMQRMGHNFDDYLKQTGKTIDDLKKDREGVADKRVKTQLALTEIAHKESVKLDDNDVKKQIEEIKIMHKDAPEENIRLFVERFEMNRLVWKTLESML